MCKVQKRMPLTLKKIYKRNITPFDALGKYQFGVLESVLGRRPNMTKSNNFGLVKITIIFILNLIARLKCKNNQATTVA